MRGLRSLVRLPSLRLQTVGIQIFKTRRNLHRLHAFHRVVYEGVTSKISGGGFNSSFPSASPLG